MGNILFPSLSCNKEVKLNKLTHHCALFTSDKLMSNTVQIYFPGRKGVGLLFLFSWLFDFCCFMVEKFQKTEEKFKETSFVYNLNESFKCLFQKLTYIMHYLTTHHPSKSLWITSIISPDSRVSSSFSNALKALVVM